MLIKLDNGNNHKNTSSAVVELLHADEQNKELSKKIAAYWWIFLEEAPNIKSLAVHV
jgi:hypothetical protein